MIAALVPALAAAAITPTANRAAQQLYTDACLGGNLRVAPGQGRVVQAGDLPEVARYVLRNGRPVRSATFIEMRDPPGTFVLMTNFKHVAVGRPRTSCIVVSRSLDYDQTGQLFVRSDGGAQFASGYSTRFKDYWVLDQPKLGYRQRLWREGDWVGLEAESVRRAGEPGDE